MKQLTRQKARDFCKAIGTGGRFTSSFDLTMRRKLENGGLISFIKLER
jgi:hypothetical protein